MLMTILVVVCLGVGSLGQSSDETQQKIQDLSLDLSEFTGRSKINRPSHISFERPQIQDVNDDNRRGRGPSYGNLPVQNVNSYKPGQGGSFDLPNVDKPMIFRPSQSSFGRPQVNEPNLYRPSQSGSFGRPSINEPNVFRPNQGNSYGRPQVYEPNFRPNQGSSYGRPQFNEPNVRPGQTGTYERPHTEEPMFFKPSQTGSFGRPHVDESHAARPGHSGSFGRPQIVQTPRRPSPNRRPSSFDQVPIDLNPEIEEFGRPQGEDLNAYRSTGLTLGPKPNSNHRV